MAAEPVDVAILGERLRRERKSREATLRTVAEETDISIATLSRIERGDAKSVDGPTLLALAKWMGASAQDFLERPEQTTLTPHVQETPDVVELHLRADRNLDRKTAMALARMFRAAYESLAGQQRAGRKKTD